MAYPGPGSLDGASRSLVDGKYLLIALEDDSFQAIEQAQIIRGTLMNDFS